jgi:hypothetical protein
VDNVRVFSALNLPWLQDAVQIQEVVGTAHCTEKAKKKEEKA